MDSILNWASRGIKNATSSAASGVLRYVINKFLEKPLESDSRLTIQSNWDVQLSLKSLLVSTEKLNTISSVIAFKSFYISSIEYNTEINLTKQKCNIDRIIIEIDLDEPFENSQRNLEKEKLINDSINESINDLKKTLPIQKDQSVSNWFFDSVETIDILIDRVTLIITINHQIITLEIKNLSLSAELSGNNLYSGKIEELSIIHSESRVTVLQLENMELLFSNDVLTINCPNGSAEFIKPFILILARILNISRGQPESESKTTICVNLANVNVGAENNLSGVAKNLEITVRERYIDLSLGSIETFYNFIPLVKAPNISLSIFIPPDSTIFHKMEPCPRDFEKALEWQNNLHKKIMMKMVMKIPEIAGDLTDKSLFDIIEFGMLLKAFSGDDKMGLSVILNVGEIKVTLNELILITLRNPNVSVFVDTMIHYPILVQCGITNINIQLNDFIILRNTCEGSLIYLQLFDDDKTPELLLNVSDFLLSIPYEFPKFPSKSDQTLHKESNILVPLPNIKVSSIFTEVFVDYISKYQPARIIGQISMFKLIFNEGVAKFDTFISAFLSNERSPIPFDIFMHEPPPFNRYGFCEILQFNVRNGFYSLIDKGIDIPQSNLAITLCSDSFEVLKCIFMESLEEKPKDTIVEEIQSNLTKSINMSLINKIEEMDFPEPLVNNKDSSTKPIFYFTCKEITLSILFYGGRDLNELFDLRILKKQLPFTNEIIEPLDFDLISPRNENECIELVTTSMINVESYEDRKLHFGLDMSLCDLIDHIKTSKARMILSTEFNGSILVNFDSYSVIKNEDNLGNKESEDHCSISIELPKFGIFITNEQLQFFITFFSKTRPFTPSFSTKKDTIIDYFSLKGDSVCISANFKYFLSVSFDDVELSIKECVVANAENTANLIGQIVKFYLENIEKLNIITGLPVLSNFKRIGNAVVSLFTFDIERLGLARGLGISFGVLMRTLATETLNASTCVTSTAENLIKFAIKAISGDDEWGYGMKTALATLIISPKCKYDEKGITSATGEFLAQVPRVLLTPGVIALDSTTNMLRYLKNIVNPNERKIKVYLK
ncbi:hypothetical protein TRFO_16363 [Tritrichomonas foetus]|uniref:Uncharacterized protein n=1 Tax=Tritrichomonas foetus TaxID=1144522 RepID=A0A1J4KV70_9EUKA|nr:hypothetical protein TRFO_16363 [Tritrichomonas foetus]|eukprot:OHT13405.1 hypothetical protein TRFO_16363 [Tritrichomonas foetus]